MRKAVQFLIILSIFIQCNNAGNSEKICKIEGKVVGRDSKTLILKKSTDPARFGGVEISISDNGIFEHSFEAEYLEEYELIFQEELENGAWRPIVFFPDSKSIYFELYPMEEADKNLIKGSPLSSKEPEYISRYQQKFGESFGYWYAKMDSIRNNPDSDSNYMDVITTKIDSISIEVVAWQLEYIEKDQSIFAYSKFRDLLNQYKESEKVPASLFYKGFDLLKTKFPDHPYTTISQNLLDAIQNIKIGGTYTDFTASDGNGVQVRLSDQIKKNKLTLLDLWAPWCGPCIRKSRKVAVHYERLKASGFDVVAVVGGISSRQEFDKAVEKHSYPWTPLMEVNDQNEIWEKYKIRGGGGSQFLIDNKGIIIEINPDPERIAELLNETRS